MSAQAKPETSNECGASARKAQLMCGKLAEFVSMVRIADKARWKMWNDVNWAFVQAVSAHNANIGKRNFKSWMIYVDEGFSKLGNGVFILNACLNNLSAVHESSAIAEESRKMIPGAFDLIENGLYRIALYDDEACARIAEIIDMGKDVSAAQTAPVPQEEKKQEVPPAECKVTSLGQLMGMSPDELQKLCDARGLTHPDDKNGLIIRLLESCACARCGSYINWLFAGC